MKKKIKEERYLTEGLQIETRDDGAESRTISGYAVVFNRWSADLGWFKEMVDPAAFRNVSLEAVIATFNHDFSMPMARTDSQTLKLTIDDHGLRYQFEAPNTTAGNDLLENVRNGNVKGSSFMFTVESEAWEYNSGDELDKRTITEVDELFELGPVTNPAYPDTTALSERKLEFMRTLEKKKVPMGDLILKRKRGDTP